MKRTILLIITNQCNLRCKYCYEVNKNRQTMSMELAQSIIVKEMKEEGLQTIEFHGGEPLMNFKLLKEVCEWFWATYKESDIKFFLTTNGTLFTADVREWFEQHKSQIICSLSLDGTPEMNQHNRGCIVSPDTMAFIQRLWPEQAVKMTISQYTISQIAEGVIYAHEQGFHVSANLAYGVDWRKCSVKNYERELDKLVEYYISHPSIPPCSLFDGNKLTAILTPEIQSRHCGAGKTFTAYDTNGNRLPCHVFADNTLKAERWAEIANQDFSDDNLYKDPDCGECPIYNICPTCFGMNFIERNHVRCRDKSMCEFIKAEKTATCRLFKHKITSKNFDDISEQEYLILSAIQKILG